MGISQIILLIIFLILLCSSALFSGSETALFSMTVVEREKLKSKKSPKLQNLLQFFKKKPDDVLVAVLTGNMLVNIFATAIYEDFIRSQITFTAEIYNFAFPVISMTFILLLFGELLPKRLAVINPLSFIEKSGLFVYSFLNLSKPVWFILAKFRNLFIIKIKTTEDERQLIRTSLRIGFKEGIINEKTYQLADTLISLNSLVAEEIMLPRAEIPACNINQPVFELIELYKKEELIDLSFPYILVYQQTIDQPAGYLEIKDLVPFRLGIKKEEPLQSLIKPCHLVPLRKRLNQLMAELKEKNTALAVIIDEYGGTAGAISFKQIAETVLSSFSPAEGENLTSYRKNAFMIPGRFELKKLEKRLGLNFQSSVRTVAGLILEELGEIPVEGQKIIVGSTRFTIRKMQKNRIKLVWVEVD